MNVGPFKPHKAIPSATSGGAWHRPIIAVCTLLFAVIIFCFYQFLYPYHFYYQEQNQLFLQTGEYLRHYFDKPAGLSRLVGDWLTQYYYYRFAGPVILSLAVTITGLAVRWSLSAAGMRRATWLVGLLVATLLFAFTWHYSYLLSSVLSVLFSLLLFCGAALLSRHIGNSICRYALLLLPMPLSFVLFGYGWMVYAVCLLILETSGRRRTGTVIAIVSIFVMLLAVPATKRFYWLDAGDMYSWPGMGKIVKPEFDLETDFGAAAEYRLGNWDKVTAMVEATPSPTEGQLFFYNLVQAQRGNLPNVILKYPNNYLGTFEKIGTSTPLLTLKRINELYWALGDATFAERAALQALVFSPDNRNVGMIKRLAEVNIVSGDKKAADKYLRLLDKTAVYHSWALAAPHNPVYAAKKAMVNRKDTLRTTDNAHVIMMELLDSNPRNTVALDYILCSDLMLKDIANFKRDYDRYCMRNGVGRIFPVYQEALMIWLAGTGANQATWEKYIKMPELIKRFSDYNAMRGNSAFSDTYWYWFDTHKAPEIK